MKKIYEVIIVGAGPVGCYLGALLRKANVDVALIDQRKTIGEPVQCAGIITPRVFSQFHIPKEDIVQQAITGAHITAPDGTTVCIGDSTTRAYSIDRYAFDQYLASEVESLGATIIKKQKVIKVQKQQQMISIQTNKQHIVSAPLIIGADGPYSIIRSMFGFPQPLEIVKGIGAEIQNVEIDPHLVKIHVGKAIAPGFFAWVIPTNKKGTTARIGLCVQSPHKAKPYFEGFFLKLKEKTSMQHAKIKQYIGGTIPLGMVKQPVHDQVMLVGDAAAQVKPTSGGGIYSGLCCASLCADTAIQAIQKQVYSMSVLRSYPKRLKSEFGKELIWGMRVRRLFTHLSDDDFNKYINQLNRPKIIETINKYGDIDYPSRLFAPLITKDPSFLMAMKHYPH